MGLDREELIKKAKREDCYCENYSTCQHCEEECHNDDIHYIVDRDIYVCEYCRDNNYTQCEDCGDYVAESDCVDGDKDVCLSCVEDGYCDDCLPEDTDNGC